MRMLKNAIIACSLLFCSVALTGCSTLSNIAAAESVATAVAEEGMEKATTALILAENSYTATTLSVAALLRQGVLPASAAPTVRSLSKQATAILNKTHLAKTAAEKFKLVDGLKLITEQLKSLKGDTS